MLRKAPLRFVHRRLYTAVAWCPAREPFTRTAQTVNAVQAAFRVVVHERKHLPSLSIMYWYVARRIEDIMFKGRLTRVVNHGMDGMKTIRGWTCELRVRIM